MQKRKQTSFNFLLVCGICVSVLCGCQGMDTASPQAAPEETIQSDYEVEMEHREGFIGEEEYEQNFARPQVNSNIYVDFMGYAPDDQKYAYFVGEDLSESFYVLDSATGKCVYTGILKKMGNEKSDGKSVYKGDFSEMEEPGVYYIQTAIIGQSYKFRIDENRYQTQFEELKKEFLTLTPEEYYGRNAGTLKRMQAMYSFQKLATAYQFFPDAFGEEYEKKLEEHAEWFLETRQNLLLKRAEDQRPDYNEPGEKELQIVREDYTFASAMATGYTVLREYNAPLASQSLSQAQRAYQNANRFQLTDSHMDETDLRYMAAAALFRTGGSYSYHAVIKDDDKRREAARVSGMNISAAESSNIRLWGNLFYMTSVRGADITICDRQMSEMMGLCGSYLDVSPQSAFGLIADRDQALEASIWLAMADYIIVSREYRNVCKEQMHSLFHNIEEMDLSHEQKATLLLILGNMTESEETE